MDCMSVLCSELVSDAPKWLEKVVLQKMPDYNHSHDPTCNFPTNEMK